MHVASRFVCRFDFADQLLNYDPALFGNLCMVCSCLEMRYECADVFPGALSGFRLLFAVSAGNAAGYCLFSSEGFEVVDFQPLRSLKLLGDHWVWLLLNYASVLMFLKPEALLLVCFVMLDHLLLMMFVTLGIVPRWWLLLLLIS
ncbi:hypothetical protein Nepgr_030855 [Nepenthes gracilis]|uniref:Uncharacterized protein n=1 Tax=Nepenthes gracilis TaxID=150966 RepID=A0AAD3THS4_NEPGR|nr:hypothetical protein Nepgr_030855 [Nepenthes gracilis]